MSYAIESIAKSIGVRRVGEYETTIDWLLTDAIFPIYTTGECAIL